MATISLGVFVCPLIPFQLSISEQNLPVSPSYCISALVFYISAYGDYHISSCFSVFLFQLHCAILRAACLTSSNTERAGYFQPSTRGCQLQYALLRLLFDLSSPLDHSFASHPQHGHYDLSSHSFFRQPQPLELTRRTQMAGCLPPVAHPFTII